MEISNTDIEKIKADIETLLEKPFSEYLNYHIDKAEVGKWYLLTDDALFNSIDFLSVQKVLQSEGIIKIGSNKTDTPPKKYIKIVPDMLDDLLSGLIDVSSYMCKCGCGRIGEIKMSYIEGHEPRSKTPEEEKIISELENSLNELYYTFLSSCISTAEIGDWVLPLNILQSSLRNEEFSYSDYPVVRDTLEDEGLIEIKYMQLDKNDWPPKEYIRIVPDVLNILLNGE